MDNLIEYDITVALCTYSRADLLSGTLVGLTQQHSDGIRYDILVIDDGSTDNTLQVVEDVRSRSSIPIRYVYQSNLGIGSARNRAVAETTAEWIAFIDDDEIPGSRWLKELITTAKREKADCVGGPCLLRVTGQPEIDAVGTIAMLLGQNPAMTSPVRGRSLYEHFRLRITRIALPGGGNALVRTSLISRLGGFPRIDYGEDLEFFRKAQREGVRFAVATGAVVYHLVDERRLLPGNLYSLARRGGGHPSPR